MTHAEAFELLATMTASGTDPMLEERELDALLATHRIADRYGSRPIDSSWEPTYDFNAAAAEGWRWKAAKVSDRFSFSSDAGSFSRDQVYAHCLQMASHYSSRVVRTLDPARFADDTLPWGDLLP